MKILLVAGVDLTLPGGLETHVIQLAHGLERRGHDVSVHMDDHDRALPHALMTLRLVPKVEPDRYDIVHHHGGPWRREWDAGPRYLKTFHFSVAAKMAVYLRMRRLRTLFNLGNHRALAEERAALRRGRRPIAVSRSLRDELVRYHGVPREAIEVIPNGASFDPPPRRRDLFRERMEIPPGAPMLLTIGRDDYVKGFDLLARAWDLAERSAGPSRLPDGAIWVRIGGQRASRTVTGRTLRIATGSIDPAFVTGWIHAADVGAVPSYYEGGGIALTDMLAGGLYVLTHAVGVAPEAIRPGENGEIVPRRADGWAAALARALSHPARSHAPGLSPEWSWEAMATKVEAVYERLRRETP